MINYQNQLKGKQILLGSAPTDINFVELKALAKYLKECGCEVRWYTSRAFSDQINEMSIQHYPFKKAKNVHLLQSSKQTAVMDNKAGSVTSPDSDNDPEFKRKRPEFYADIVEIYKTFPFDLIITDSSFSAVPFAKKRINIPVVTVGAMPLKELLPVWLPLAPVYLIQKLSKNRISTPLEIGAGSI